MVINVDLLPAVGHSVEDKVQINIYHRLTVL